MTELLDAAMFTPHVGSGFAVRVGDYDDVLTLIEVGDLPRGTPNDLRDPFSLLFTGQRTDALFDQQMLLLAHPVLGQCEMMLTPCGRDTDGTFRYQAVFN